MIVKNIQTLNKMQSQGLIKFAPETGCKIAKNTIFYVDSIINNFSTFTYQKGIYKLTYVSGCFYPYVTFIKNN